MSPATIELVGRRNASFVEEYAFKVANAPVDLSGCTARMQLRHYGNEAGSPLLDLTPVSSDVQGVWIKDAVNGVIQVRINQSSLAGLPSRVSTEARSSFSYDLRLTWPDLDQDALLEGTFVLKAGVTR